MLRWARERAGLSLEEAAQALSLRAAYGRSPVERLAAVERGDEKPARGLLLKMEQKYRRPLVLFYMEAPPRPDDRAKDFRTLPETVTPAENALAEALVRDIQVRQSLIREALLEEQDEESAHRVEFVGSRSAEDGVAAVVSDLHRVLSLPEGFAQQLRGSESVFRDLRDRAESTGVFVVLAADLGSHHSSIDVDVFRGFALADNVAPFVVINNRDAKTAWSFTLLHEFVHLLIGETGVSGGFPEHRVEQFCNEAASRVLLPPDSLDELVLPAGGSLEMLAGAISDFAFSRNVSAAMVAYRLFLERRLNRDQWTALRDEFRQIWREAREARRAAERGGPSYTTLRKHRLGRALIDTTLRLLQAELLTAMDAGVILGVKPKRLERLRSA